MSAALTSRSRRTGLVVLLALAIISPWPILALTYRGELQAELVAVPSQGPTLDAPVARAFSRGPYFLLVNLKTQAVEALENPYANEQHAVGVRCAALLSKKGVGTVLVQDIGPEPFNNLSIKGARIFHIRAATVSEALEAYRAGELAQLSQPSVPTHFGLTTDNTASAASTPPCPLDGPAPGAASAPASASPVALPVGWGGTVAPYVQGGGALQRAAAWPRLEGAGSPTAVTAGGMTALWTAGGAGAASNPGAQRSRLPAAPAAIPGSADPSAAGAPLQLPELGMEVVPYPDGGVRVHRIYTGSPAEEGGLLAGDYLLEVQGRPVLDAVRLIFLVTTASPRATLTVRLVRHGRVVTTALTIPAKPSAAMEVPADAAPPYGMGPSSPSTGGAQGAPTSASSAGPVQVPELGMEVAALGGGGVRVVRVYQNSWADQGGLQDGDVLLQLDGKNVADLPSLIQRVQAAAPEAPAPVTVLRQGRLVATEVTVGEGEMETVTLPPDAAPSYKTAGITASTAPAPAAKSPPAAPAPPAAPPRAAPRAAPQGAQPAGWVMPSATPTPAAGPPAVAVPELGLTVQDAGPRLVQATRIWPGSIAQRADLRAGDVLYQINSRPIGSARDLSGMVAAAASGTELRVKLMRHGRSEVRSLVVGQALAATRGPKQ